jgi:hypothetical protein
VEGNRPARGVSGDNVQRLVFVVGPCQLSTRNGAAMGRVMQRSGVALDATGNPYVAGTRQGGDSGNGLLATKTHLDLPLALRVSPSGGRVCRRWRRWPSIPSAKNSVSSIELQPIRRTENVVNLPYNPQYLFLVQEMRLECSSLD